MRKLFALVGSLFLTGLAVAVLTSTIPGPVQARTIENPKNNCACTRSQGCECHWAQIGDPACGCLAGHPEFCHNACTCISLLGAQVPDFGPSPAAGKDTEVDGFYNGISTVGGYAMDNDHDVNLEKSWRPLVELKPAPGYAPPAGEAARIQRESDSVNAAAALERLHTITSVGLIAKP